MKTAYEIHNTSFNDIPLDKQIEHGIKTGRQMASATPTLVGRQRKQLSNCSDSKGRHMKTNHTPAPWALGGIFDEDGSGHIEINAPTHGALAIAVWRMQGEASSPECEANAKRIVVLASTPARASIQRQCLT